MLQSLGSEIISPVWFQMSGYGHHERHPPVTPLPGPKARGAWTPVMPVNHCSSTAPRWPEAGDKAGVRRDLTMSDVRRGDAGEVLESNKLGSYRVNQSSFFQTLNEIFFKRVKYINLGHPPSLFSPKNLQFPISGPTDPPPPPHIGPIQGVRSA